MLKKKISTLMVYATFPTTLLLTSFLLHEFFLGTGIASVAKILIGIWVLDHAVNTIVKYVVRRDRPEEMQNIPVDLFDYSFPSWHSESTFAFFLGLALFHPAWWTILLMIVPVMVGYNRIYMKHHYPSDVIGGFAIGAGIATICRIYPMIAEKISPSILYWLGGGNPILIFITLMFILFGPFSVLIYLKDEESLSAAAKGVPTLYMVTVGFVFSAAFLLLNLWLGIHTESIYLVFVAIGAGGLNGITSLREIIDFIKKQNK